MVLGLQALMVKNRCHHQQISLARRGDIQTKTVLESIIRIHTCDAPTDHPRSSLTIPEMLLSERNDRQHRQGSIPNAPTAKTLTKKGSVAKRRFHSTLLIGGLSDAMQGHVPLPAAEPQAPWIR
jgi:hypothetical protein